MTNNDSNINTCKNAHLLIKHFLLPLSTLVLSDFTLPSASFQSIKHNQLTSEELLSNSSGSWNLLKPSPVGGGGGVIN